jgi:hypothetical protein
LGTAWGQPHQKTPGTSRGHGLFWPRRSLVNGAPRRFPPPWSIDEQTECIIVRDATGLALAYLYFEDEPQRQRTLKRLSRDEAFLVAVNIAKLPGVPRQILKDIPRPPTFSERRVGVTRVSRREHR